MADRIFCCMANVPKIDYDYLPMSEYNKTNTGKIRKQNPATIVDNNNKFIIDPGNTMTASINPHSRYKPASDLSSLC